MKEITPSMLQPSYVILNVFFLYLGKLGKYKNVISLCVPNVAWIR